MSAGSLAEAFVDILPDMSRFGGQLKAGTERVSEDAGKTAGKKFSTGLVSGLKAAAAGVAVGEFLKSSIDASKEAATEQEKLNFAYEKFPALASVNIEDLRSLNEELGKKTKFDKEETAAAEAVLAQYKLSGDQIKTLIPLVQDYAARTGKDLTTAAGAAGKAILGQGRALKDAGIKFKDTGTVAGNFTELQAALNDKVGGFAEKEGKSAAGQAEILSNQYKDLKVSVGDALVPALTSLLGVITPILEGFNSLPEPVKQGTVLLGGLAAAALFLAPKLESLIGLFSATAVAETEAAAGAEATGIAMGTALGPIGLAITAIGLAAGAVLLFSKNNKEAVKPIEDITAALSKSKDAYLADARAKQFNEFATADNLATLRKAGVPLGLVQAALEGNTTAQKALNDALDVSIKKHEGFATANGHVIPTIDGTGQALADLKQKLIDDGAQVGATAQYWDDLAHSIDITNKTAAQYRAVVGYSPGQFGGKKHSALGDLSARAGVPQVVGDGGRPEIFVPKVDGAIYSSPDNARQAMRGQGQGMFRDFIYQEAPGRTGNLESTDVTRALLMYDALSGSARGG